MFRPPCLQVWDIWRTRRCDSRELVLIWEVQLLSLTWLDTGNLEQILISLNPWPWGLFITFLEIHTIYSKAFWHKSALFHLGNCSEEWCPRNNILLLTMEHYNHSAGHRAVVNPALGAKQIQLRSQLCHQPHWAILLSLPRFSFTWGFHIHFSTLKIVHIWQPCSEFYSTLTSSAICSKLLKIKNTLL